jgi:tetratricopeptide (TPR) repeat protein
MRTCIFSAALLFCCAPAVRAQDPVASENAEMKGQYDKAFGFYVAGDYAKAIEYWNMVLRADPKQTTARNMIEDARRKMAGSSESLKSSLNRLLDKGLYADALIKLEELLATDPTNPYYLKLQGRLRNISALVPARPAATKAWNAAAEGISAWLSEKEDLPFAYDALRYASELAPAEKVFGRLTAALEEGSPQLKLNDSKPENTGILEHKKKMALDHIYDSKFYMAVKELEGVLRLEPRDVIALKRAGSAYLQLKNYRQARRAWQKALEISPKDEQLTEYLQALDKAAPAEASQPKPKAARRQKKKG